MAIDVVHQLPIEGFPLENLRAYLASSGWMEVDSESSGSYWAKPDEDGEIWLPSHTRVITFRTRILELLRNLEDRESRPYREILGDVLDLDRDIQEIRTFPGEKPGETRLSDGVEAVEGIRKWIESAAVSVAIGHPQAVLPRRKPGRAQDLISATNLLVPGVGSFIWRISTPIADNPRQDSFSFDEIPGGNGLDDYSRLTTKFLYSSTMATVSAAQTVHREGGSLEPFRERINQGVTANLCEALDLSSSSGRSPLSIRFRWATRRPVGAWLEPIEISLPELEIIAWAGREFRREAVDEGVTIHGVVVRLVREGPSDGPGQITIAGRDVDSPENSFGHYWVELTAEDYLVAAEAHSSDKIVEITGDVHSVGNRRVLRNPSGFGVIYGGDELG
ncbi:hypothetical protein [Arthrobacter rhizosphaerae]|uniref:hypothetical protein n=1 Tax=Arthrobacter rhizosphaerae TaxID=2855490 RepID=UPI001FF6D006|nr:hypothetical protein [Arthrobacter rhizosphaerae]